jgi:hypothetical protein
LSITFLPLSDADRASVRELLVRASWKRDWTEQFADQYISWRYDRRGSGETLVASDRGRCVGIIDSFMRPYWIDGRQQVVRETCDWFCLPEYRALGVGLHLMRRTMAKPEPILVIGGTGYTQNLLPRLKWARLPDVGNFILGVSARTVAGLLALKRWQSGVVLARGVPDIPLARRPPRLAPPSANSQARVRVPGEAEAVPKSAPYVVAPALDTKVLDWFARAPEVLGRFLLLNFFCDGEPVGVSISRLHKLPHFGWTSQIVHLHAARFEVIDWMVSETVHHLIARDAGVILCRASCPTTAGALSALGFWRLKPIPAYWWPADTLPPSGSLHFTRLWNSIEHEGEDSPLCCAAAEQPGTRQMGDIVTPLRKRHRLTAVASFDDADRAVATDDQWTCGRDVDDRAGSSARRRLPGGAQDLDVETGYRIEPRHIGGRGEGFVVSGANKIDNFFRTLVPIDAPVQGVAMPVEPAPRQVLRDVDECLAANDLGDDTREELGSGGKTASKEGQPSIVRPDREAQLTDNGTSIDLLFYSMDGHAEFSLAVADRPLVSVETGILRQEPRMKIQAAPLEQLQNGRRNNEGAVDVDEPSGRPPGQPFGFRREARDVDDRDVMPVCEFGKRIALRTFEHQRGDRYTRGFDQDLQKRSCRPPLANHDEPHQSCPFDKS